LLGEGRRRRDTRVGINDSHPAESENESVLINGGDWRGGRMNVGVVKKDVM
jgi:hypothetical protein